MFEQNSANCKELTVTASVPFYSSTLAINLDLIHSKTAYYIRKKSSKRFLNNRRIYLEKVLLDV